MKDYYRILGILDDAEDIIVRAAYKALAQRYHPDKWKGNKDEANKRMQEINEAYETLSDAIKRNHYDEEYFKAKPRDEAETSDTASAFEEYDDESDEAWVMACEFYPIIASEYSELKKISLILANTYKRSLISNQSFKESTRLKIKYEEDYLERFYGQDKNIQRLAKQLLLKGQHSAAIRINKIVRLMGKSIDFNQIKQKIFEEFPEANNNINRFPKLEKLIHRAQSKRIDEAEAYYLMDVIFKAHVTYGIFSNKYSFTLENGKKYELTQNEFFNWIAANI
jgi:curved DNA-binding protein CbpA